MKTLLVALLFAAPAAAQTRTLARSAEKPLVDAAHTVVQPDEIALKRDALIYGDPAQPGTYLLRRRLAANQTVRPHYDDHESLLTVLKGTLWIGKGDVFAPDKLAPVREGGVAFIPAATHYFLLADDQEVVVQVTGSGPVKTVHTEVDAAGKPVPVNGPYPVIAAAKRRNMPVDPDLLTPDQIEQMERAAAAKRQKK